LLKILRGGNDMKLNISTALITVFMVIFLLTIKAYGVGIIDATFDNPVLPTLGNTYTFIPGHVVPTGANMSDRPWKITGSQNAFMIENSSTIPGVTLTSGNFLRIIDSDNYAAHGADFDFYDTVYDNVCVRVSWDVLFEESDNYYFAFRNGHFDDPQHPAKSSLADIYTAGNTLYFESKNSIVHRMPYQTKTPIHFDVYLDLTNNKWAVVMDNKVLFNNAEIIDAPFGLFIPGYLHDRDLNGAMEVDNIFMGPMSSCEWPQNDENCSLNLPNPQLQFIGSETYTGSDGNQYIRYKLMVTNWTQYPNELFTPSPDLPPCGINTNASRTWVHIEDEDGRRLYGFCALDDSEYLTKLWFAKRANEAPPRLVRIIMKDRLCNKEYRSNLVSIDTNTLCRDLPVPQLEFVRAEAYSTSAGNFTRYRLSVTNWNDFWPELFVPSPNLPPCGLNTEASRTWVDIYDANNNRLYGFCGFGDPEDLTKLWFAVKENDPVPEQVKIVITDRLCQKRIESPLINLPVEEIASLKITIHGSGRVISDSGLTCTNNGTASSATCNFNMQVGTSVNLQAIPLNGDNFISSFLEWEGACRGSGNCSLTIAAGENAVSAQFAAVGRPIQLILSVPNTPNVFTYEPVAEPEFASTPQDCKPFAVGDLDSGKINLKVALPAFNDPVDIYLGIQATPVSPFEIYLLVPVQPFGYNIVPYSTTGLVAWKQSITEPVYQSFFGEIPVQALPAGPYTLYTLVTPAGHLNSYYLWVSTFTIP